MYKYFILSFIAFILINSSCFAQTDGAPITVLAIPSVSISGKQIEFSGNTLIGKEILPVFLTVTSPDGKTTELKATTDIKGNYKFTYTKAFATGQYIITAKTADQNGVASDTFQVTTITGAVNNIQIDFFKSTQTVQKGLDALIQSLDMLPSKPDLEVQKAKLNEYKKK